MKRLTQVITWRPRRPVATEFRGETNFHLEFIRVSIQSILAPPILAAVDEYVWTYARGIQRIEVRRRETADGHLLIVTGGDSPGSTTFRDMAALVAHQSRFEGFLIKDGWSFIGFVPERRTQADRRSIPRPTLDRRRWWSDAEFRRRQE